MLKRNRPNWGSWVLTILLFVLGYVGTYYALSYAVPGLRLPLDTPTENYMAENLRHMMTVKGTAGVAVGLLMAALPRVLGKR